MNSSKPAAALAFFQSNSLPMLVQEEIERLIMTGVRAVGTRNGAVVEQLACEPGVADPVLAHLGAAVIALLARRQPPSRALLRRVAMGTCAHLVHAHGVTPDAPPRGHRAWAAVRTE